MCTTNGWIKDLNYINYTKREKISWKSINSIELMQKFIYDNLITKSELHDKYKPLESIVFRISRYIKGENQEEYIVYYKFEGFIS